MKTFFSNRFPSFFLHTLIALLFVGGTIYASTTIGTNIITGGTLSVTGSSTLTDLTITGTCTGCGGGGTVGAGTTGQIPYYAGNGTALTATSSLSISPSGSVSIGATVLNPTQGIQITGVPVTPNATPGLYIGPNESLLPVGLKDWTGGLQNVLLTSVGQTALQIEATSNIGGSAGVLSVENFGINTPSAIYTENHSEDDSLNLAIQGTAYADAVNTQGVWGGYFSAGVLKNANADAIGGIVLWNPLFQNSGTATNSYGLFAKNQCGSSIQNCFALWADDESVDLSTNSYYSWFDSRGVRRVKEDNTFNGVGQAIEALYNPQFTKYTPGATDYERVVLGQWNSNVAEIGTQAGGTGTSRPLRLLGSNILLPALNVTPHTPASSSEACTVGQISNDASYVYVCTATNTWKRSALSAF